MANCGNECCDVGMPTKPSRKRGECRSYVDDITVSGRLEATIREALLAEGYDVDITPIETDGGNYPRDFHMAIYENTNNR